MKFGTVLLLLAAPAFAKLPSVRSSRQQTVTYTQYDEVRALPMLVSAQIHVETLKGMLNSHYLATTLPISLCLCLYYDLLPLSESDKVIAGLKHMFSLYWKVLLAIRFALFLFPLNDQWFEVPRFLVAELLPPCFITAIIVKQYLIQLLTYMAPYMKPAKWE